MKGLRLSLKLRRVTLGYVLSDAAATLTSAAGAVPTVDITMGADIFVGFYLRIQRNATGSGGYGSLTLDISHMLTAPEKANGAIPNANMTADGYINPSGAYWQRYRWEREDGAYGPWSEVSGIVTITTTTLDPSNKHASLTVSGGNLTVAGANQGAAMCIRTTQQVPVSGKYYAEVLCNTIAASDGMIEGACNSTQDMTAFSAPGNGNANGGCLLYNNNIYPSVTFAGHSAATGDRYMLATSRNAAGTAATFWIGVNGTWLNGDPSAGTGGETVTISQCWGVFGMARGSNLTVNLGASAFTYTKPTGFTAWS